MRRLAAVSCALAVVLGSIWVRSHSIVASGDTEVTIACGDGSSMTGVVGLVTLAELTQEVQAMLGCTLSQGVPDTNTPVATGASWTVYDYNPSNQAIRPRNSPGSRPATTSGTTTMFDFLPAIYTALLTTTDKDYIGDLSGRTVSATVSASTDAGTFSYRDSASCPGNPPTVRLYFSSAKASGPSYPPPGPPINGLPPAGFYTQFWWATDGPGNTGKATLLNDGLAQPLIASLANPAQWSDWDGQNGATQPDAFYRAAANVKSIGLSFGGGCFYENGVTFNYTLAPPPYETFSSTFPPP